MNWHMRSSVRLAVDVCPQTYPFFFSRCPDRGKVSPMLRNAIDPAIALALLSACSDEGPTAPAPIIWDS